MLSRYVSRIGKISSSHVCSMFVRDFGQPTALTHPGVVGQNEVTPHITRAEYKHRRDGLAELIRKSEPQSDHHIVLFTSHDRSYMAEGIPFIYRQHSNMHYLTGFLEADSALVMEVDKTGYESTLFVKNQTAHEDLWEGSRSGEQKALIITGVENATDIKKLPLYLSAHSGKSPTLFWYNQTAPASRSLDKQITPIIDHVFQPQTKRSPEIVIQNMRLIKSEAELQLMRTSGNIAAEMFIESMIYSLENPHEHHLFAKFDFECRTRGASNLAYLPVVAGGENGLTIHYIRNDSPIPTDSMVLVDAGVDYYGYVSDVTRTWPVSGKYTAAQREVYEAVQEVYDRCIELVRPGEMSLNEIHLAMQILIGEQLQRLGVINSSISQLDLSKLATDICPHHVGHYLGLDVHDTPLISRNSKLQPGMVICIEPGMYFGANDPRIKKEFRALGIRIEDDLIVTKTGHENLTNVCPTDINEIESLLS